MEKVTKKETISNNFYPPPTNFMQIRKKSGCILHKIKTLQNFKVLGFHKGRRNSKHARKLDHHSS